MTMHTAWLILFIIALVGAVVFLGLLFAGYVSEKWMVHRKVYAIMLAIFCALTIWFNREYQVTMPKSSMSLPDLIRSSISFRSCGVHLLRSGLTPTMPQIC